jgi:hypothetical protein
MDLEFARTENGIRVLVSRVGQCGEILSCFKWGQGKTRLAIHGGGAEIIVFKSCVLLKPLHMRASLTIHYQYEQRWNVPHLKIIMH